MAIPFSRGWLQAPLQFRPHIYALSLCAGAWLFHESRAHAQIPTSTQQKITIPTDVPLRIRITRTANLRQGAIVEGLLTEPVYVYDRLVIPQNSPIEGIVRDFAPVDQKRRTQVILNGDLTPLHDPVVNFNKIHLQNGDVTIQSLATIRDTQLVRFRTPESNPTIFQKARQAFRERVQSIRDEFSAPGKKDRAMKLLYSQLPYHPQRIWADTQFVANLTEDATVPVSVPVLEPAAVASTSTLTSSSIDVTARLASAISSDSAKKGDAITALVTKPVFTSENRLLLPEGAKLTGTVLQSKASRSFGRNGQIRFVFSGVQRTGEDQYHVHGTVIGAAGSTSQNLTVDQEGGVKSNPDKNRFIAPLALGVLAAAGHDQDKDGSGLGRQTVAANGLGLIARVVAIAVSDRNVATGFGAFAFAKSIYFRFLTRGHAVVFPKDTLVEVELTAR